MISPQSSVFIERLRSLQAPEEDDDLPCTLRGLIDLLYNAPDSDKVIPAIFDFLERHPEADCGSPGPLVHFIERYPGKYESILRDSLERRPVPLTLWMCNRILNSLSSPDSEPYLNLLEKTSLNHSLDENTRSEAASFLRFQMENGQA